MLSLVETLKDFRKILLGQQLKIFTDYKNLTCEKFNTKHILRWRIILEEYSPDIEYIPGNKNMVEDESSILPNSINKKITHESKYTMETMLEL